MFRIKTRRLQLLDELSDFQFGYLISLDDEFRFEKSTKGADSNYGNKCTCIQLTLSKITESKI